MADERIERAAPGDSAGHQGSYTAPQDTLVEPSSSSNDLPTTSKEPSRRTDLGINVTLLIAILGIAATFFYCAAMP